MVIDIFSEKNYYEIMRNAARGRAASDGGIMRVSSFKRTIFVLIVVLSVITAFALAGCEDKDGCTHVWNDGEITTAATCTQAGVKTFTCTLCGETRTEVVGSSGHVASETFENSDPEGHYHVCSVCGEKTDDVQAHAFEDGEVIKQPSATEEGLQKIVCSVCGYESTKVLPPTSHTHAFDQEIADAKYLVSQATCEKKAVYYKSCACGEAGTETFEYGEYAAHALVKTDRIEATCAQAGVEAYWTCSACGKLFSDENGTTEISAPVVIPATGEHEYVGEWQKNETGHWKVCECGALSEVEAHVPDKDAPTETEGVVCTVCGYEIQPAAGHVHAPADQWSSDESYHWHACEGCTQQLDKDVHVFADKHDENGHWKECTVCGKKIEESEHDWDEGVVTTKPTLTSEGEKTYTCACGETRVEKLPAKADFAEDFTLEEGQPGPWSYGSVNYSWGASESFTFTQATAKNEGGDGWLSEGAEIKKGWISAGSYVGISYKTEEPVSVMIALGFTGSTPETKVALRIGIKDADGNLYYNPDFIMLEGNALNSVEKTFNLSAGDEIYLIFSNENGAVETAHPSGDLSVVITKVADSEHVLTKVDAVAPTCTTSGTAEYYTCSHCDKIFADANANKETESPVTIDALGHDTDGVNWTAEGNVHYKACKRCGAHIDEAAHSGGTASCEAKAVCEVCGAEYGEYAAHALVKTEREEATCAQAGVEAYWTCSACGKLFSDENGTNEISEPVVIPATGNHVYGADLVKDATGHWYECSVCGNKKDFAEHTPDKDAPTETEGVVCTVCDYQIEPAAGHEHSPSDVWSADDQYHWHDCGGCSQQLDKAEHLYDVQKVSNEYLASAATCMNKATYYYSCECGAKGTATFESGEVAGHVFDQEVADQKYLVSAATCTAKAVYYKSCVCGETGTETFEYGDLAEHQLVAGHNADSHYDECSVCHAKFNESAHVWNEGVITTKPTLTSEGEKTYTCACGETKVEKLAAQASLADDFTLEEGQPGPWRYGSIDYKWGPQEDFTFTQATAKNEGGDGWAADGVEIKGGWINANNMMAVAYTVDSDVTVKVNLTFTGGTADTRLSLRTGVKNADGVIDGNPAYFDGGKQSNVLNYETTLELKAGDTVYFILGNENDENPAAYPNGGLDIVLTQVIG